LLMTITRSVVTPDQRGQVDNFLSEFLSRLKREPPNGSSIEQLLAAELRIESHVVDDLDKTGR
jgi:hypothetical protein